MLLSLLIAALLSTPAPTPEAAFKASLERVRGVELKPNHIRDETLIVILHPLVKEKETAFTIDSTLKCGAATCTRTVTGFEQTKGRPIKKKDGKDMVGQVADYAFLPRDLATLLALGAPSELRWTEAGKALSFVLTQDGVPREGALLLDAQGAPETLSFGAPVGGIGHHEGVKETEWVWRFGVVEGRLALRVEEEVKSEKKNGIPFVTRSTRRFGYDAK